jgi:hypothetical protein
LLVLGPLLRHLLGLHRLRVLLQVVLELALAILAVAAQRRQISDCAHRLV